jgi:hypothetical protein
MEKDIEAVLILADLLKTTSPDESVYRLVSNSEDEEHYIGDYKTIRAITKVWEGEGLTITKGTSRVMCFLELDWREYKFSLFYKPYSPDEYKMIYYKKFRSFTPKQRRELEYRGFTVTGGGIGFAELSTL